MNSPIPVFLCTLSILAAFSMPLRADGFMLSGDGYAASFEENGEGTIATYPALPYSVWGISCPVDDKTGRRMCTIYQLAEGGIGVGFKSPSVPERICVIGHDAEDLPGMIMIDSHDMITTDNDGCIPAGKAMFQLATGGRVATKRFEGTSSEASFASLPLQGLPAAMIVAGRVMSGALHH